jgi:RNA polymerase II subunit A small phosphatase-like protein
LDRPADFRVGPFYIYRRPHLSEFLKGAAAWYELALWSSATSDYVGEIAREICPKGVEWTFIWSRERCTQRLHPETFQTTYLKDLKKVRRLGYPLERIVFVDDTPEKLARNYGNAVYLKSFEGSVYDAELELLLKYIESIRRVNNYRTLEKRGWRIRLQTEATRKRVQ